MAGVFSGPLTYILQRVSGGSPTETASEAIVSCSNNGVGQAHTGGPWGTFAQVDAARRDAT